MPAQRHHSPLVVCFQALLAVAVVLGLVIGIPLGLGIGRPVPKPIGIARAGLSDGTQITIVAITNTPGRHAIQLPGQKDPSFWKQFEPPPSISFTNAGTKPGWRIWMIRTDPRTGEPLPIDWWLGTRITDRHGWVHCDDDAMRNIQGKSGSSGYSGSRPMSPASMPAGTLHCVYSSHVPIIEANEDGTARLEIVDDRKVIRVALNVPVPIERVPVVTPAVLPQTVASGDVSVTLHALEAEGPIEETHDHGRLPSPLRYRYKSKLTLEQGGKNWGEIHPGFDLKDAFGNQGHNWSCELSPNYGPWKLTTQVRIPPSEPPLPDRVWVTPPLTIPDRHQFTLLDTTQRILGSTLQLRLQLISGPGAVSYPQELSERQRPGGGWGYHGHDHRINQFKIELDGNPRPGTTKVTAEAPHVRLITTGLPPLHRLEMQAKDQDGTVIEVIPALLGNEHFFLFATKPTSKTLTLTVLLVEYRNFTFDVPPPALPVTVPPPLPSEAISASGAPASETQPGVDQPRAAQPAAGIAPPAAGVAPAKASP